MLTLFVVPVLLDIGVQGLKHPPQVCNCTLLLLQTAVFARTATRIRVGTRPDFVTVNLATNLIYSSNSGDGTVSVIDGATNTVTATITVGGFPQGIAANPATNKIYVALFAGSSSMVSVI